MYETVPYVLTQVSLFENSTGVNEKILFRSLGVFYAEYVFNRATLYMQKKLIHISILSVSPAPIFEFEF